MCPALPPGWLEHKHPQHDTHLAAVGDEAAGCGPVLGSGSYAGKRRTPVLGVTGLGIFLYRWARGALVPFSPAHSDAARGTAATKAPGWRLGGDERSGACLRAPTRRPHALHTTHCILRAASTRHRTQRTKAPPPPALPHAQHITMHSHTQRKCTSCVRPTHTYTSLQPALRPNAQHRTQHATHSSQHTANGHTACTAPHQ
jgi:hypothetical protein